MTPANDPRWDDEDAPPDGRHSHIVAWPPVWPLIGAVLGLGVVLVTLIGVGGYLALRAILTALGG